MLTDVSHRSLRQSVCDAINHGVEGSQQGHSERLPSSHLQSILRLFKDLPNILSPGTRQVQSDTCLQSDSVTHLVAESSLKSAPEDFAISLAKVLFDTPMSLSTCTVFQSMVLTFSHNLAVPIVYSSQSACLLLSEPVIDSLGRLYLTVRYTVIFLKALIVPPCYTLCKLRSLSLFVTLSKGSRLSSS